MAVRKRNRSGTLSQHHNITFAYKPALAMHSLAPLGKPFLMHHAVDDGRAVSARALCVYECECGVAVVTYVQNVRLGFTRSCGCKALIERRMEMRTSHPLYVSWQGMLSRCSDENYDRYGGRGIKVCDRWRESFEAFVADMGPKPSPTHSIDRKDNDGDYTPENCRWATPKEQSSNTAKNRWLTIDGVTMHAFDWSKQPGAASRQLICQRLNRGIPHRECVFGEPYRVKTVIPLR